MATFEITSIGKTLFFHRAGVPFKFDRRIFNSLNTHLKYLNEFNKKETPA
ncbi:hypothetical protein ACFLQL_01015 [Verrucomicrobiota bacterium]